MNSTFTKIVRYLLALMLLVFGLNKFLKLLPMPELPPNAAEFMTELAATGYVLPVVGAIEIFIGILLLINKWTPFALVLLAPISVNILLFHLFLDLPGIGGALIVAILNGILIYKHWSKFRPLFA
ncbi:MULTISPECIES: DoxX family membrane protein [Croceibacter]|uniref:DoxX family membrane protein n=1 Tax=Croceibacter TaxID=216431 RepID=UPI000C67A55C|nr:MULTISPECIES: DoxX family membrane protein [Croceibacter]MBG26030.1 DoxX protein [Croceibacter sp.]|tara:strand:+ start:43727 stop:44101 length:375 start_codon:yes stop_codon:yes gene_type:complete